MSYGVTPQLRAPLQKHGGLPQPRRRSRLRNCANWQGKSWPVRNSSIPRYC